MLQIFPKEVQFMCKSTSRIANLVSFSKKKFDTAFFAVFQQLLKQFIFF